MPSTDTERVTYDTNIVLLSGHLGAKPESRELNSGVIVTNFSLATSTGYGDRRRTEWHKCSVFGTQATEIAMYGDKGDAVSLKGHITYGEREGKYYTNIIVDHLKLTKKRGGAAPNAKTNAAENEFEPED